MRRAATRLPVVRPGSLRSAAGVGFALLAASPLTGAAGPESAGPVVLSRRCVACHNSARSSGRLDLSRRETAMRARPGGAALVPGNPAGSRLMRMVEEGKMPPTGRLSDDEAEGLRAWIRSGAPYPRSPLAAESPAPRRPWYLEPVRTPPIPHSRFDPLAKNEVDRFIFVALERRRLAPSAPAPRLALLRRVTVDLTGLPPTPAEVQAFLADRSADAYEKVVDRLLASPAYGERWARHWLDVVRFGESNGYEQNHLRANAWPYRDYVIRALNSDIPFPRFVAEQLAGDVVGSGRPEVEVATGFLVAGVHDTVGIQTVEGTLQQRANDLDDIVSTTGAAFLGLTVGCARCHDHKFDPIPQQDYYRLAACFAGVQHGERPVGGVPVAAAKPDAARPAYVGRFTAPETIYVLRRGDVMQRAEPALPGALSAVTAADSGLGLAAAAPDPERRLALARWIGSEHNPLTARVIVNRVWQHHFGRGIVATPSDFGANGEPPSHPELLDWLAARFVDGAGSGWRLKPLHRLLVTSYTYRQSASPAGAAGARGEAVDSGNRLLWHMPLQRMEAEAIRDSILAASGKLDRRMGGPGFPLFRYRVVNVGIYEPLEAYGPETWRRGIYSQAARAIRDDLLGSFDCPETSQRAPRRDTTTTPLQALTLLNGPFAVQQAEFIAGRIRAEAGGEPGAQVGRAFMLAFGRPPTAVERERSLRVLGDGGLAALSRALINASEFLYY